MPSSIDFDALDAAVERCALPVVRGVVTAVRELAVEASLPAARKGMRIAIKPPDRAPIPAEVAVCDGDRATLLPFRETTGVGVGDPVEVVSSVATMPCGPGLIGRIVDPAGRPLDEGAALTDVSPWPLDRPPPEPLSRPPVDEQLVTGLRVIDGCLALGRGQRIGLFAGPGQGKSTLLATLARRAAAEVSVICLVGERGREAGELVAALGREGLARSVLVLATADAAPLVRARALTAATAVAEWFRAAGQHVLLLVDSLTRVLRARRDVALALGETPARGGFPAAAFATLPSLLERAGRDASGSITAVYAVLTEGSGAADPIAEEARSLLDGHIVLSPTLARAGRWPAVDVLASVSRVMDTVVPPEALAHAAHLRRLLAAYQENQELILIGAYRRGSSADTDLALERKTAIDEFLGQHRDDPTALAVTRRALSALVRGA